jgi:hypothetical protein
MGAGEAAEQQHRAAATSGHRRRAASPISAAQASTAALPQRKAAVELLNIVRLENVPTTNQVCSAPPTAAPPTSGATPLREATIHHSSGTPPSGLRRQAASRILVEDSSTAAPDPAAVRQPTSGCAEAGVRFRPTHSRTAAGHASEEQQLEPRTRSHSGTPRANRCCAAASPNVALQPTCGARMRRDGRVASAPHAAELWR